MMKTVTEEELEKLSAQNIKELNLEQAIKCRTHKELGISEPEALHIAGYIAPIIRSAGKRKIAITDKEGQVIGYRDEAKILRDIAKRAAIEIAVQKGQRPKHIVCEVCGNLCAVKKVGILAKGHIKCLQQGATRKYRAAHPEKAREANRKWDAANPEKRSSATRKYRAANQDKIRAADRKYREANTKKRRETKRKWHAKKKAEREASK